MNKQQYNNVIDYTLKHDEVARGDDSLATARAVFNNMGVALPGGTMKEVYDTIQSDDYMGWHSCTMQEAQEAANNGIAAIGISEDRIVMLSAADEEQPVTHNASVMVVDETTPAMAVAGMRYYAYTCGTTTNYEPTEPPSWSCWANGVLSKAEEVLGCTYDDFIEGGNWYDSQIEFNKGKWCVDFVRWCCKKAGVYKNDIIPNLSSTSLLRNWYRDTSTQQGTLHQGYSGIQPGDIVFIAKNGALSHTCIATSAPYNGKVDTINGNWGDIVAYQTFPEGVYTIASYAHPHYERA